MKRNPKDRGYGYKKSYEYEESIKESRQINVQNNRIIDLKDKQHFKLWCEFDDLVKEFKLLCNNVLNDEIPRDLLKAYSNSYLEILNKIK